MTAGVSQITGTRKASRPRNLHAKCKTAPETEGRIWIRFSGCYWIFTQVWLLQISPPATQPARLIWVPLTVALPL